MIKDEIEYISLDSACTLFWDIGCEPRSPMRPTRSLLTEILEYFRKQGYIVMDENIDPLKTYDELWRELSTKHPGYQHWHRYILLKFLRRRNIDIDEALLNKIYEYFIDRRARWFLPVDHTRMVLEELVGRGYKLVLTTATGAHDLPYRILLYNDLLGRFQLIYSTQLTGIPKDNPLFYEELADLLGVKPHKIVHVGDSIRNDILPARRAGLKTIYYGWKSLCIPTDPQPCITSLTDLLKIL